MSLDVALPVATLAQAQESLACFLTGKGWMQTAMPARKGRREHTPAWRPLLLPWHSRTEARRGGQAVRVSWAVKAQIPEHRQRIKKLFFTLFLSHPVFHQPVCQAGAQHE